MRSPVSAEHLRRLVEKLSPASPMREFNDVRAATNLKVSLRTGGPDRRSRIEILNEMRAAAGLEPFTIPVGSPIGPLVDLPPNRLQTNVDDYDSDTDENELTHRGDARLEHDKPIETRPLAGSDSTARIANPLELVWLPGAPTLSRYEVSTDEMGGVSHCYTFSTVPPRSWTHVDGNENLLERPPPRSVLLGKSLDSSVRYWGTAEGAVVACRTTELNSSPNVNTTHRADLPPGLSPQQERARTLRERTSPLRDVALAVMTLASALVALTVANSPTGREHHFDPGHLRRMDPYSPDTDLLLVGIYLLGLVLAVCAHQAKVGGGWIASRWRGPTAPNLHAQWAPLYHYDRRHTIASISMRFPHWKSWIWLPYLGCELAVVSVLCVMASKLRLRVSLGSAGRCMLPKPMM